MPVSHHTAAFLSTYAADTSGVCSALYELGGMTVIHDASGCNSTYNTHDEPRWYDMDSLVYISALTEIEAIMGDDERWICDVIRTAKELRPAFITLCSSPVPMMTGTDLDAEAAMIERETGILTSAVHTNGMHSYVHGAGKAFRMIAERLVDEECHEHRGDKIVVNILGVTPLDFSVCGAERVFREVLLAHGFDVESCWAMGESLDQIRKAGNADVNLVVSETGLDAAHALQSRFGIPYVLGTPVSEKQTNALLESLRQAASDRESRRSKAADFPSDIVLIGEGIQALSLADAIEADFGIRPQVICPTEPSEGIRPLLIDARDEEEIIPLIQGAAVVIADPLYRPVVSASSTFIPWPHEACSGRIFQRDMKTPADFYRFLKTCIH